MTSITSPAAKNAGRTILILGLLSAAGPFATGMYLPGFSQMENTFGIEHGQIEISLSVFFLGLAIGQAFYGPLIDRFGRRGPLLAGIAIFTAASIAAGLTSDFYTFLGLRFLQAVGGCAGMIIGRAIIRDLFDERESARALSLTMSVMTIAPIVAPIVGGALIAWSGWRTAFGFMVVFGLVSLTLVTLFMPETIAKGGKQKQSIGAIFGTWGSLIIKPAFIVPVLVGGFAQACMFSFITGSPFVFMTLHGADSQTYGFLFAVVAFGLLVSAQVNRIALSKRSPKTMLQIGLGIIVVAAWGLVLSISADNLTALLVPLWFAVASIGIIGANSVAIAMSATGRNAGSGSALLGIIQFSFAFLVSTIIATTQNGTAYPMALSIAGFASAAVLMWLLGRRAVMSGN